MSTTRYKNIALQVENFAGGVSDAYQITYQIDTE